MNSIKNSAILLIIILAGFISCKKSSNSPIIPSNPISTIVQQGNWKITLFSSNGTDETTNFSGYSFKFNSNGTITAVKGASTVSGTWSKGVDDSQPKLLINFGVTPSFDELTDDWHITSQNTLKIVLIDVSGGGGGTDYLTFEKI